MQRYQMFNEPDHPNAGGLTQADYLQRIQLVADAVQSALTDVNPPVQPLRALGPLNLNVGIGPFAEPFSFSWSNGTRLYWIQKR